LLATQQAPSSRASPELTCYNAASSGAFSELERSKLQAPELLRSLLAGVFVACKEEGLLLLFFAVEEKEEKPLNPKP